MKQDQPQADVCIILEGTYPYVSGGVSGWTHQLLEAHSDLTFHLLLLLAPDVKDDIKPKYQVPDNVIGMTKIILQKIPKGSKHVFKLQSILQELEPHFRQIIHQGGLNDMIEIIELIKPLRKKLGSHLLLNSKAAWAQCIEIYKKDYSTSPFIDYFWTWRALFGGLYSILLEKLPSAKVYHAVSTGYAGICLARAQYETGRPALLTEHGIYTNERRIEIAMADWLFEDKLFSDLSVQKDEGDLKNMWLNAFLTYSKCTYDTCYQIITLYEGNQEFQKEDGADPEKLRIIPNGINVEEYEHIEREPFLPPTIGLIGRVVPIKDIKTYIRTCALTKKSVPDLMAYICGPTEEDEEYYQECVDLVNYLGLEETIIFTGKINIKEYFTKMHLSVLTSISEAQPLVILEAGAAGIPSVTTDVGACREMILGGSAEEPFLGKAGDVVNLSDPEAMSKAVVKLLTDKEHYDSCCKAIQNRVRKYYNKVDLDITYKKLYKSCCQMDDDFSLSNHKNQSI